MTRVIAAAAGAAVALAGVGTAIWYFAAGPGHHVPQVSVAISSNPPAPDPITGSSDLPTRPLSAANAAAYDIGSCFDEQIGSGPGKVKLNLVPCGGDQSVFVINKVVSAASECDADYQRHGYEVPDETVGVVYCAALVVPANQCFVLGGNAPITRAACGSGPDVVTVQSIESAPNVNSACVDTVNPDIWYYQSPSSGQFACVSRPTTKSGSATPIPTA